MKDEFYKNRSAVNGRRKGINFERSIAKKLNGRFKTEEFCRTPGSGAFGTTHKLPQYLKVHGDLITPENFKFVIECKNGYDVQMDDIFKRKSDLYEFIKQAERDGEASGRDWLLIYKKTRRKEVVVTTVRFPVSTFGTINNEYFFYSLSDLLELEDLYFLN